MEGLSAPCSVWTQGDSEIRQTIDVLVRHGVAVTSTLAVLESYAMDESEIDRACRC